MKIGLFINVLFFKDVIIIFLLFIVHYSIMIYAKFFLTKYNKLTQIKLYKIAKNNNLTSSNIFEWHKKCPTHIHFLALIKKEIEIIKYLGNAVNVQNTLIIMIYHFIIQFVIIPFVSYIYIIQKKMII